MKSQSTLVGLFFILVGMLILIYWIILPVPEKERIYNEIIGGNLSSIENQTNNTVSFSSPEFRGLFLSKDGYTYVLAQNYILGKLVNIYDINLGEVSISTNIFSGSKSKKAYFYYNLSQKLDGVFLEFSPICDNGKFVVYINDKSIYEGCESKVKIFVDNSYLKDGVNEIKLELYPNSILSSANLKINNLKLSYAKRSYLKSVLYYNGGRVFLDYNFCPTDPSAVKFRINGVDIPFPSCSSMLTNTKLEITPYLKTYMNTIELYSNVETNISLIVSSDNSIFVYPFNKDYTYLQLIVSKGSGEININGICKFYIDASKDYMIVKDISKCILDQNILAIKANDYLYIEFLSLK